MVKENDQRTNNDVQNITQKNKYEATRTTMYIRFYLKLLGT
jgi:hypothetical protein